MFMSGWMGIDLAQYGLDEPIGNVDSNAILSAVKACQPEYAPGTLRNNLFRGGDRLPDDHRGATYRVGGSGSTIIERPSTVTSSSASVASLHTRDR